MRENPAITSIRSGPRTWMNEFGGPSDPDLFDVYWDSKRAGDGDGGETPRH